MQTPQRPENPAAHEAQFETDTAACETTVIEYELAVDRAEMVLSSFTLHMADWAGDARLYEDVLDTL